MGFKADLRHRDYRYYERSAGKVSEKDQSSYPASVTIITVTNDDASVVTLNNRYNSISGYVMSR